MPNRILFDALTLSCVLDEAQALVGARIDKVRQFDPATLILHTQKGSLLISADPREPRAYLTGAKGTSPEGFAKLVKDRLEGGVIESIAQIGFDRRFSVHAKGCELVADLIGTRANLTLLGQGGASRLRKVAPPSGDGPASLSDAARSGRGLSKAMAAEVAARGVEEFMALAVQWAPAYYPGLGAYPIALASIAEKPMPMASLSQALEKHYIDLMPRLNAEATARALRGQLAQAVAAREKTLAQIDDVLDTAAKARKLQMFGELILAHRPSEMELLETEDYDGKPVVIALDASKSTPENADRYFSKAKKAKNAAADLKPKAARIREQIELAKSLLDRLGDDPQETLRLAQSSGLMREQQPPPEKRIVAHDGFKVRETEIGGFVVLWGENATANDYVTTRIAKPNDYWLHVRGAHGSHVVLRTGNQPDRVPRAVLEAAAVIAAKNSNQKHAKHVPVTLTLAKHVRKPRKAAPGAVTFTNDKTLFVDP